MNSSLEEMDDLNNQILNFQMYNSKSVSPQRSKKFHLSPINNLNIKEEEFQTKLVPYSMMQVNIKKLKNDLKFGSVGDIKIKSSLRKRHDAEVFNSEAGHLITERFN